MKIKIVFIVIILLASLFSVKAQFVEDALRFVSPNVSPSVRASSLGVSYFGFADDGSAVVVNPAGMTLVPVGEFGMGINLTNHKTNTNFLGNTKKELTNELYFTNINFVWSSINLNSDEYYETPPPENKIKVSCGFDYHISNDFVVNSVYSGFNPLNSFIAEQAHQKQEWVGSFGLVDSNYNALIKNNIYQEGYVYESGGLHNLSFGMACDINPIFAIGGTFTMKFGTFDYSRKYFETDKDNIYNQYFIDDMHRLTVREVLTQDLFGITGVLGLQARLSHYCRLGLSVRFPTLMHDSEYFSTNYEVLFDNDEFDKYPTGTMFNKYKIITPFEITLGASGNTSGLSYSVSGSILNAASTYFSVDKNNINLDYDALLYFDELNEIIEEVLTTQFTIGAGLEYKIPNIPLYLRGSYTLQTSPYKNKTLCSDKSIIGAGVGLLLTNNLILDASFVYTTQEYRRANYGSEAFPMYFSFYNVKHTPTNFQLGIRYRFD
ncbi:MAG: hypothetical protein FWG85_06020 [Bacteroidetes bacterium]|nr:hypothetical protein [Bacteroidota bacterium]